MWKAQILGMIRYEFIMHWRRRPLLVITLAVILITVIMTLIIGSSGADRLLAPALSQTPGLNSDQFSTFLIVFMGWSPLAVVMAVLLPIVLADTVPLDRDTGVRELMDSLPMRPLTYFAGKVVGAWAAALVSIIVSMLITGVVWRLQVGVYDLRTFAEMWLLGATSLIFLNGGLGILLSSTQPSRRRAAILMVVFFVVMFITAGRIFDLSSEVQSLWAYANPLRAPIILYYAGDTLTALSVGFFSPKVTLTLVAGVVELGIAVMGLLLWTRWREQGR
jgi:ABC-type transport system involved in multi-copper enzyme maturation permease subunit